MKCFLPNKHYHSFFHTCWPMDCSPQGFNHRSQHLQIHPAMHKTTQNETKLWKIKSPLSWPGLVASDCLNPYGICDLQIYDIYKLIKNLSLSLSPLHHHSQFALNLPQIISFLNIFLRLFFTAPSSSQCAPPCLHWLRAITFCPSCNHRWTSWVPSSNSKPKWEWHTFHFLSFYM